MASTTNSVTISLADIEPEKSTVFQRVLFAVLRSTVVKSVFSQIIDGLPVNRNYEFMTTRRLDLDSREEPTEESKTLFDNALDSLTPLDHLQINAKVCGSVQTMTTQLMICRSHNCINRPL